MESAVHIENYNRRQPRGVTAITTGGSKRGQSKPRNRAAIIWRVGGRCSLKAHSQTMFKEHHVRESIGNTGDGFDGRGLAAQKCSFLNLGGKDEDPVGASGRLWNGA